MNDGFEILDDGYMLPSDLDKAREGGQTVVSQEEQEVREKGPERKPCPECGKNVTWTQAGKPRSHKCEPKVKEEEYTSCSETGCKNCTDDGSCKERKPAAKGIPVDEVIAKFVDTRDEITKLKKAFEAEIVDLKDLQEKRGLWLKSEMEKLGVKSFKCDTGTCFVDWKDSAIVADGLVFIDWVHTDWEIRKHFLENRVSKAAVKQRLEDGEVLPPGVNYVKVKDVKIRRA